MENLSAPEAAEKPSLGKRILSSPLTWLIAAVNVGVFLLAERSGDTMEPATLVTWGADERSHIWAGESWRFVTSMFLHIGWIHLAWNTWAMFGWCAGVERAIGSWRFLTIYLLSGIGASATSVLCHDVVSAGASGAGFGVIGMTLVLLYRSAGGWGAFINSPGVKRMLANIGLWTVMGLTVVNMDNFAHGGGLAFGLALGLALTWSKPGLVRILAPAAVGVVLIGTLLAAVHPWPGRLSIYGGYEAATKAYETYEKGDYALALKLVNDAESLGYGDPSLHCIRGGVFLMQRDFHRAVDEYDKALQMNLPSEWAYFGRGEAYLCLGATKKARNDYEAALKINPQSAKAHAARGRIRHREGDWDGAMKDYTRALDLDPALALAFYDRGVIRYDRREWKEALEDFRKAAESERADRVTQDYGRVRMWMTRARLGEVEKATEELAAWLKDRKPSAADEGFAAIGAFLVGGMTEADFLKTAERADPKESGGRKCQAFFYAGMKRLLTGDTATAAEFFKVCLQTGASDYREYGSARAELEAMKK